MNAKELKDMLTIDNILSLMEDFGVYPIEGRNENELLFKTICHGGDSNKLYFYKSSKNFHCYTNCGSMDILQVIQNVMGCDLPKAIKYICSRFGFSNIKFQEGFGEIESNVGDWNIINRNKDKLVYEEKWKDFKTIDENVLRHFYKYYHKSFYEDGISFRTLNKFEIMFDIDNDRVIIPHRHEDGTLVAIRCRNLSEKLIETGRKYMPVILNNKVLSAPTSQYFFGLYHNKKTIKKAKKVILVESEKAVMQYETMFPNANITLALSSSSLSNFQIKILKELNVEEIIIALDKEYESVGSREEIVYGERIKKTLINRLKNNFNVSVIWDTKGFLNKKESPTDRGKDVFLTLFNERKFA